MNSQQVQDMRLMYEAVYNDELWELANEYNNSIYDEDIVEVATEYFYTYGLNEDGIDILIEKVGLDNFVEFVYDLSEDLTILTEARSAKKRTGGESYADVKAKIDAKEAAKKKAKEEALKRKESERMEPASNGADTESKKEQPKSKKPIRDAIARQILAGMKRHREATQTAGRLASETGNTLGKIASVTREAGRRAGEHVKKHGMKSLANSYEYDTFDAILEHLIAEGYADTNESALAIMANMSEEWREEILDEEVRGAKKGTIRSVIEKGGKSIKYVQSGGDILAGDRSSQARASAADRKTSGRNRANAARFQQAAKKSIKTLNANPGEDPEDYGNTDDDHSGGERHYKLGSTNRSSRARRASGR
jgi:hypothetical protein